jgi:hypothetical protein
MHDLETGDSLAMRLDQPLSYRNMSQAPVRYAVVLTRPRAERSIL